MVDLTPVKDRLAKCIRLFGSTERANARDMTERALASVGANWSDLGNWIEHPSYTEAELQEYGQAKRAEGIEEGIKLGMARASNGGGNGRSNGHGYVLPEADEMEEYCRQRLGQLKDDAQRKFIAEMYASTRRGISPLRGPLGYLVSIYIKHGGRT